MMLYVAVWYDALLCVAVNYCAFVYVGVCGDDM